MLVGIVFGKYFDSVPYTPNLVIDSIVEFLKSVGAAVIVIGGVNAIIETMHWRHYFENRLKDIVVEQNYLNSLDRKTLENLHVKLLQAQFKDSSISGDESFFSFYNKNIHQYMGGPFREDASSRVTISETPGDEPWHVEEVMRFTCRKNGGKIQESVSWKPDESQILDQIKISVRLPGKTNQIEIFNGRASADDSGLSSSDLRTLREGIKLGKIDVDGEEFDLTQCDRLLVEEVSNYRLRKSSALTWSFALPTRKFYLAVFADKKYEMAYELFAANDDGVILDRSAGSTILQYNEWMLPQNGIVVRLFARPQTGSAGDRPAA